jgi:hypothetical protein
MGRIEANVLPTLWLYLLRLQQFGPRKTYTIRSFAAANFMISC